MRLKAAHPSGYVKGDPNASFMIQDFGETKFDEDWWWHWLHHIIWSNPKALFFLTEETTDVRNWEIERAFGFPEWNFNEYEIPCGAEGPREATSNCVLKAYHRGEHQDINGGTWPY